MVVILDPTARGATTQRSRGRLGGRVARAALVAGAIGGGMAVSFAARADDLPPPRPLHPPATQAVRDHTPRPYHYVEPRPLDLPSREDLKTVRVEGRTYHITRLAPLGFDPAARAGDRDFPGIAHYDEPGQSLSFVGSGRGGVESRDRLVLEDCTFVIDFQDGDFDTWDRRRAAVYVEGYREVVVRNCVFVSKALAGDPERKVTGSIVAYDCLNVQIEDSYFHGRTLGWRGHILVYCCGPTHIRNVEIDAAGRPAGGIWVATGVGEGKIGWVHEDRPELMIYPPGPLLIENAHVHDEKGKENADGIYIQSVQPYLVRNCRVENWGPDDSLIDVGFRDAGVGSYDGRPLANHGAVGVIENCHFAEGWIKDSVGVAGGLIFRNNVVGRGAWLFPYVFDGGSWWVVENRFEDMSGVIVSGRNGQFDGWTPKEGMFVNGSKMRLHRNRFEAAEPLRALYVAGVKPAPLADAIVADHNIYKMPPPLAWGVDVGEEYATFAEWREKTGNDGSSIFGPATADLPSAPRLDLPGGVPDRSGGTIGLTGPVGVQNPAVLDRARAVVAEVTADLEARQFWRQIESFKPVESAIVPRLEKRRWAGGGEYLTLAPAAAGDAATFVADLDLAGRYYLSTHVVDGRGGLWQLAVDGKHVGLPVVFGRRGSVTHGEVTFAPGVRTFTYTALDGQRASVDSIEFRRAEDVDRDAARRHAVDRQKAERKAERDRLEALKVRIDLVDLEPTGAPEGRHGVYGEGDRYRLWQPDGPGDSIEFEFEVAAARRYAVALVLVNQQDQAELRLSVEGRNVGTPVRTARTMHFGELDLSPGTHKFTLSLADAADVPKPKIRLDRLELTPKEVGPAEAAP